METNNPPDNKEKEASETQKNNTLPEAAESNQVEKPPFALDKILLPQKEEEARAAENAPHASVAAVLADQALPLRPSAPRIPRPLPDPPLEETSIQPLETYQGDIEEAIQGKNISVVTIAAAEAGRRSKTPGSLEGPHTSVGKTFGLIIGGIVLLCAGGGLIAYFALAPRSVSIPPGVMTPIITVDETKNVLLDPNLMPSQSMATLQTAEGQVSLSLGLIEQLLITEPATSTNRQSQTMDAQTFLSLLAPDVPQTLLLTVQPQFLLGVYSYQENQPFLILKVNSYQQAFSGMLSWENTMGQDFSPLFITAGVSANKQVASSTATSTPQILNTPFTDSILENHDARVLEDAQGNILLLWTFLDPNTVVIATSDATLHEIISRLSQASILSTP